MASSIYKLSKNLAKEQFIETAKFFPRENLELITRKLAYPCEYIDCLEKYQKTQLPSIDKFYNSLNSEHVNEVDYKKVHQIWDVFQIRNRQEFTNLYNKVDVLLLADIMDSFRNIALKTISWILVGTSLHLGFPGIACLK